jgi:hypothetical protein
MSQKNLIEIVSYYDLSFVERNKLIIQLSKPKSFFQTFFDNLKNTNTRIECFNKLNNLHQEIYGFEMYSSYESFITVYGRHIKNRKNER